ncbi:hypothetical protein DESA109040_03360 [Deinococcus saxicola]
MSLIEPGPGQTVGLIGIPIERYGKHLEIRGEREGEKRVPDVEWRNRSCPDFYRVTNGIRMIKPTLYAAKPRLLHTGRDGTDNSRAYALAGFAPLWRFLFHSSTYTTSGATM